MKNFWILLVVLMSFDCVFADNAERILDDVRSESQSVEDDSTDPNSSVDNALNECLYNRDTRNLEICEEYFLEEHGLWDKVDDALELELEQCKKSWNDYRVFSIRVHPNNLSKFSNLDFVKYAPIIKIVEFPSSKAYEYMLYIFEMCRDSVYVRHVAIK